MYLNVYLNTSPKHSQLINTTSTATSHTYSINDIERGGGGGKQIKLSEILPLFDNKGLLKTLYVTSIAMIGSSTSGRNLVLSGMIRSSGNVD